MDRSPPPAWIRIDYTNWRGERGERRVAPVRVLHGSNEWHPETQRLLVALDVDKDAPRTFACAGIHGISAADGTPVPHPGDSDEAWMALIPREGGRA